MFSKKCPHCNTKVKKEHTFCPFCGRNLRNPKKEKEDYGLLGINDNEEIMPEMPFDSILNKILKSTMKMMESQMKEIQSNPQPNYPLGDNVKVQFYVNGKKVFSTNNSPTKKAVIPTKSVIKPGLNAETISKLSQLPKKEPKSKMRRFSEKLIYEIAVPGVKNIEDILINQLENSIEIKAISDKNVYSKTLSINLPLIAYTLREGILTLELQTK